MRDYFSHHLFVIRRQITSTFTTERDIALPNVYLCCRAVRSLIFVFAYFFIDSPAPRYPFGNAQFSDEDDDFQDS
jgi:hypothetical protein